MEATMDAETSPTRAPTSPRGGVVEPATRASVASVRFRTPPDLAGERSELGDPSADVTCRAKSFADRDPKAEQWGGTQSAPLRQGPPGAGAGRDDIPEMPPGTKPQRERDPGQPESADAKAIAKIDARGERAAWVARLEEALNERYVIKRAPLTIGPVTVGHTEYRFRGDSSRIAFTESTFKLATDTDSPSVARSMIDVAQVRNWKGLRVSGSEDFRRMVWIEASVRGFKAIGYEPNPANLDVLWREQQARQTHRIEPTLDSAGGAASTSAETSSTRGGPRKAVIAAIEAVLVAKGVPQAKRSAVLAAATEKLTQRASRGQAPRVKVYDKAAPAQHPATVPTPEVGRARERATAAHTH